jgi:dimethylglycine dehydrogenase
MDLSTFSKYDLQGPDAHTFLERICANGMAQRDGGIILGHLLTPAGYIESEITVTRLAADHYYVLSAALAQQHDLDQLEWRRQSGERFTITDVTDDYGTLVLAGPRAREVLTAVTGRDLSTAAFRWLTGQVAEVAGVPGVRLLRVNYVGELGWELHVPMARMPKVFDALMSAGAAHGIGLFGTYAMNSLRMEKAYRGWGADLTNEITMVEADMERFVNYKKDFIGKAGTLRSKHEGPRIVLTYLEVDADRADCLGNEPVYIDGELAGLTSSGGYGFALQKSLAFAYLRPSLLRDQARIEISIRGDRRVARVIPQPAWDPKNERLRS